MSLRSILFWSQIVSAVFQAFHGDVAGIQFFLTTALLFRLGPPTKDPQP